MDSISANGRQLSDKYRCSGEMERDRDEFDEDVESDKLNRCEAVELLLFDRIERIVKQSTLRLDLCLSSNSSSIEIDCYPNPKFLFNRKSRCSSLTKSLRDLKIEQ